MILNNARGFEYGVHHFYSPKSGYLADILCLTLELDEEAAHFLIRFGCIYVEKQRCIDNISVNNGTYIRAHTKPRRFLPEKTSGLFRLIFENKNYFIIDKPHGLPCHPTVDNLHENLLSEIKKAYPHQEAFLTHRLDVATSGLIVYAKNLKAQRAFNYALTKHEVTKKYIAQLSKPPAYWGRWEHWMEPSPKAPKNVLEQPPVNSSDWQQCLLDIQPFQEPPEDKNTLPDDSTKPLAEVTLLTGRTHQIRAQSKAMASPIVGDTAYGGDSRYDYERINLTSYSLSFVDPINQENIDLKIKHNFI